VPGSGGLSPAEIQARERALSSRDSITKSVRFLIPGGTFVTNPVRSFIADEDYWLWGMDTTVFNSAVGAGQCVISVGLSANVPSFSQPASSGATFAEMVPFNSVILDKFYNFTPYGYYIERGRTVRVNVFINPNPFPVGGVLLGSFTLMLLPTLSK
jgi:hypothetical protein